MLYLVGQTLHSQPLITLPACSKYMTMNSHMAFGSHKNPTQEKQIFVTVFENGS